MLGYPIDNRCPSLKKKRSRLPLQLSSGNVLPTSPVATEPTFIIGKNNSINDVCMCVFFRSPAPGPVGRGEREKNERLATP